MWGQGPCCTAVGPPEVPLICTHAQSSTEQLLCLDKSGLISQRISHPAHSIFFTLSFLLAFSSAHQLLDEALCGGFLPGAVRAVPQVKDPCMFPEVLGKVVVIGVGACQVGPVLTGPLFRKKLVGVTIITISMCVLVRAPAACSASG